MERTQQQQRSYQMEGTRIMKDTFEYICPCGVTIDTRWIGSKEPFKFCGECGSKEDKQIPKEESLVLACECGRRGIAGDKYCRKCGEVLMFMKESDREQRYVNNIRDLSEDELYRYLVNIQWRVQN